MAPKQSSRAQMLARIEAQDEMIRKMLLSTYGLFTADRILQKFGIKLTPDVLKAHIKNPHTFYHRLMRLPALLTFNEIIHEQGSDRQAYVQQRMINYIYSPEAAKSEDEPGAEYRQQLENQRQALIQLNKHFEAVIKEQQALDYQTTQLLKEKASAWHTIARDLSKQISSTLRQEGNTLSEQFENELAKLLAEEAVTVNLEKEVLKKYKIKGEPTIIQKATIYLLERGKQS